MGTLTAEKTVMALKDSLKPCCILEMKEFIAILRCHGGAVASSLLHCAWCLLLLRVERDPGVEVPAAVENPAQ